MSQVATLFRWFESLWYGDRSVLFFRNVAAVAIAVVACLVPEVGPNRFWLAGALVFVCVPAATWLERKLPVAETAWIQPLFDLTVLVIAIHFVPDMWFVALVIGLMVVQAPSVAESRSSAVLYALFASILTVGMTIAAVVHGVPNWELPVLCMIVLYPSVIFYSHRQAMRTNETREQAKALEGLRIVSGGVAHDFNNILTGVMGYAELALAELSEGDPARASIGEVLSGAHRASLLSARLLAFSGRKDARPELLDVEDEVDEVTALLRQVVPKGITLELVSRLEGEQLLAGRAQLQQLAMNLILNASEASETLPGRVRIELERAGEATADTLEVVLRVIDHGPGIPAELQERIFDPFFTLKERGHGLGLASAAAVARELGGRIEIESAMGEGTQMVVHLPAQPPSLEEPADEVRPAVAVVGGRALVVDDERPVRAVLSEMLRQLGYEAIEANDGVRAIECFREYGGDFGVVLLDLRMPGMDGWECLHSLRQIRSGVPIVVCSGHDPYDVRKNLEGDSIEFLSKPFRFAELSGVIARIQSS